MFFALSDFFLVVFLSSRIPPSAVLLLAKSMQLHWNYFAVISSSHNLRSFAYLLTRHPNILSGDTRFSLMVWPCNESEWDGLSLSRRYTTSDEHTLTTFYIQMNLNANTGVGWMGSLKELNGWKVASGVAAPSWCSGLMHAERELVWSI